MTLEELPAPGDDVIMPPGTRDVAPERAASVGDGGEREDDAAIYHRVGDVISSQGP